MEYGNFSDKNKEFLIKRPDTPTPWINYLNNGKYCAMVSNTGGGYSFFIDPKENRILRYRYNNLPLDRPGRYVYIRDEENGEYWSPTWQPTLTNLDNYECKHGLGYTNISSEYNKIRSEILYFVPSDENLEIWKLKISNLSSKKRNLKIFTYAEFCLGDAISDQRDLQYIQNVAIANFDEKDNSIFYHLFDKSRLITFFYSNGNISSYDCDRDSFIGNYHTESNPQCVENGYCNNSQAIGGNPIAATCNKFTLNPKETREFIFLLGIAKTIPQAKEMIHKFDNNVIIKDSLNNLKLKWREFLDKNQVETPDEGFNQIINTWNPYQCKTTFDWSRYVSFYETGIGRGIGFRDFNQDTLGVCYAIPDRVRERLLEIAKTQFESGKVYHKYFPLTGIGDFPDYVNPRMKFFGDDHLWMIFAVNNYLKETGDLSILEQKVDFVEGTKGSLYEHLKRAIDFTENNKGPQGFPLIGTADWNDCLQLHGPNKEGESVMVAMQFHKALLEMSEISKEFNFKNDAKSFLEIAEKTRTHINYKAWDKEWYIRAITDNGNIIGSRKNEEGKLYLNTQSWAVLSGVAPKERALQCMNSVRENLVTKYGIKLFNPPYSQFYPELGAISSFPPGLKENASIFCHTNPWAEIAECILGRGDIAYEYYNKINPWFKNKIAEIHKAEPYVYSQMITGNDHPDHGRAKNSWLTGTASWTFRAAMNWILGIRPEYHGLRVDPCIPKSWDGFSIIRHFRKSIYEIHIENPQHVSKGIQEITINDKIIENELIPVFQDGQKHFIKIMMG
ncbi:MAG: GH36-type glycosyl hydrolase domain-containing protein [Promethearchaeota archaeon]